MDYIRRVNERAALGLAMARFHRKFDVLLTPTLPLSAFEAGLVAPPGTDQTDWAHWTPFTFPFNCAAASRFNSVRLHRRGAAGRLQIVAAKHQDSVILRVARAFEQLCPMRLPASPPHAVDRSTEKNNHELSAK